MATLESVMQRVEAQIQEQEDAAAGETTGLTSLAG
jgi:hypothetical protein